MLTAGGLHRLVSCGSGPQVEVPSGRRPIIATLSVLIVSLVSAAAAGDAFGQRTASSVATRTIQGTTIIGDSDPVLWTAVLDLLPVRPRRIELLDLDALSEPARAKLRGLDGVVLAGHTTIAVIRQGSTLRQAAVGDAVDRLALASLVWHEMAHAGGSDECAAFAAEETLWRQFILAGRVASQVGMAFVATLREAAAGHAVSTNRSGSPATGGRGPSSTGVWPPCEASSTFQPRSLTR